MKVKLAILSNGDIVFSELEDVNIQAKKKKVDVMVKNYLRTSLGDFEIKNGDWRPFSFTHENGEAFKDKNGNVIPARDAERNILYLTDEEGNTLLDDEGNPIPKPRLNDWDVYGVPLMTAYKIPLAQSMKVVQGLNPDEPIEFLDEE